MVRDRNGEFRQVLRLDGNPRHPVPQLLSRLVSGWISIEPTKSCSLFAGDLRTAQTCDLHGGPRSCVNCDLRWIDCFVRRPFWRRSPKKGAPMPAFPSSRDPKRSLGSGTKREGQRWAKESTVPKAGRTMHWPIFVGMRLRGHDRSKILCVQGLVL